MKKNRKSKKEPILTVYLSGSWESRALEMTLRKTGKLFRVIHDSTGPIISTEFGTVKGISNILKYFDIPGLYELLKDRAGRCPHCGEKINCKPD